MRKVLLILIGVLVISQSVFALTFKTANARANALGGAYVAVGESSIGAFYNPAALSGQKGFDLTLGFSLNADNYINEDLVNDVDDLIEILDKQYTTLIDAQNGYAQANALFQKI
ncbi:hypothetical protein KA977_03385 [Candidatus Dependentiae bacterium]|nr:hypothetical protein [Candidatus Dependentiae bacterium]